MPRQPCITRVWLGKKRKAKHMHNGISSLLTDGASWWHNNGVGESYTQHIENGSRGVEQRDRKKINQNENQKWMRWNWLFQPWRLRRGGGSVTERWWECMDLGGDKAPSGNVGGGGEKVTNTKKKAQAEWFICCWWHDSNTLQQIYLHVRSSCNITTLEQGLDVSPQYRNFGRTLTNKWHHAKIVTGLHLKDIFYYCHCHLPREPPVILMHNEIT